MERKVVKGPARELILKVKEFCEMEQKNKELLIPINKVQMRVAAMTGVSTKTVSRIIKESKMPASTSTPIVVSEKSRSQLKINDVELAAIREKINFFYVAEKELPTVNNLRLELKEDINFQGSNTTLRRILKKLGFRFIRSKRKVLIGRYDAPIKLEKPLEEDKKNEPHNSTQTNKAPTMTNLKSELQDWLREKSISFEESWTKSALYDVVKKSS